MKALSNLHTVLSILQEERDEIIGFFLLISQYYDQ